MYSDIWLQLIVENDLLKLCNKPAVSTRIVVPAALREQVFKSQHNPGHQGYETSLQRIAQRFWWPRVRVDVFAFVKACEVCDRERSSNPATRSHLGHLPAEQPIAVLYIDSVGGQNSLSLGASPKSILNMIDGLTGWVKANLITDQSAATVARVVRLEWIARYGVPEQLHSDRGVQFDAAVFANLCPTFKIEKTRTAAYRPQENGKFKIFNRTLVAILRRAVQKIPKEWEPQLGPMLHHSGQQSQNRPALHRTGLRLNARCACRSILEHCSQSRREISGRWPVKSLNIWSGAIESRKK